LKFDSGVGQTNLLKSEVQNIRLTVPSPAEQDFFAESMTSIDEKLSLTTNG